MDPNYPYNNPNWNGGYPYPSNINYSQPQFHGNPYPQQPTPPAPPPPPQTQPYYQPSYSQSIPQNYAQYYENQGPNPYELQFQQPPQPFYQHPPQPQPRLPPAFPESTIEVVVPRRPSHSSPSKPQYPAQAQFSYQPQSQVQPFLSSHQFAPQPQHRHSAQPSQDQISKPSQPKVVIDIPKPSMAPERPINDSSRRTSTSKAATPQRPQQNHNRALQAVEVNVKTPQTVSKAPHPRDSPMEPDEPEPDYPSLLCVLADDYIDEARRQPALTETYYDLISKALGCLESVLANFKLPPLREAQISLRYARILYDETENHDEAETMLTKSIELCGRHKFVDLKYEMQLLLSRILYESKPKAALRDMQRIIEDIEAYRHTVWLYLFRFQHAMFSLASSIPGEVHSATVQLEKITVLAKQNSDVAILAFAATLEALLHLSSSSHDAVTAAQTSLAKARAMQLNPDVESNPQLSILTEFIDLACSVRESNIVQTEAKRKIMQEVFTAARESPNWKDDNSILIPVSKRTTAGIQTQANKHVIERNGKFYIAFLWLGKDEVEALGYLFSAESSAYKNGTDGGKAMKFVEAGLSMVRGWAKPALTTGLRQSERVSTFQKLLEAEFLLLLSFLHCSKGQWQMANNTLAEASAISEEAGSGFPINMRYTLLYLRGVILQGFGNLTAALQIYQSPLFNLTPQQPTSTNASKASNKIESSHFADSDITRNFSILAAMNSAFIIQAPGHPQHNRLSSLIKNLDAAVHTSGNKYVQAHFSLLVSILSGTTLTFKQYLKSAMEAGKAIGSAQTTALALIYMQEKLFKGAVDEQALKCAKAASHQTKRWGDPMWMHVTAGLEAQALEINGFEEDAMRRRGQAEAGWEMLPESVKRDMGGGN